MSYFIINTAVANVYKEPSYNSAVITQALMGESCWIIDSTDKWYHIRQWDGYEGWMYYFYGIDSKVEYNPILVMQDIFGAVLSPKKDKIISNLVFGCNAHAKEQENGYKIILPDGRKGFSYNNFSENKKSTNRREICKTASRFLGTPYLWGGKTPYGMDCSGLVQTVFKAVGIELPRDSYKQSELFADDKINEDNIQIGDLLFFGDNDGVSHVGISTNGLNFINARGFVQEESIDEKNPKFNRNLRNLFFYAVSIEKFISL
ncbi:NlpC/P60 family protein [Candidatus Neomarinimicrobiota bacterium]